MKYISDNLNRIIQDIFNYVCAKHATVLLRTRMVTLLHKLYYQQVNVCSKAEWIIIIL